MWPLLAEASESGGFREIVDKLARTPLSQVVAFVAVCTILRLAVYPVLKNTKPHLRSGGFAFARIVNEFLDAVIYAGVFVFLLIRPFAIQAFLIPSESMVDTLLVNDFIAANKAIYRFSDPKVGDIVVFKPPLIATALNQRDENGEVKVDFIKRCQGVPGDVVEVKEGKLYRNGSVINEPYLKDPEMNFDWKLVKYTGVRKEWEGKYIPVIIPREFGGDLNYVTGIAKPFAIGQTEEDKQSGDAWVNGGGWKKRSDLTEEENEVLKELAKLPPAAVPAGHYLMFGDNRNGSFDSRAWGLVPRDYIIGRSEAIWFPPSRWRRTK